jgi:CheY-like chemotaxis protein
MKRILVVDDDAAIRESLELLLSSTYEVVVAADGAEALARVEAQSFDAIVLDLMMPILDGAGFARELDHRNVRIPIVVVSAGPNLASRSNALGAAGFLVKPFEIEKLEEKLALLLAPPPDDDPAGGSSTDAADASVGTGEAGPPKRRTQAPVVPGARRQALGLASRRGRRSWSGSTSSRRLAP